MAKIRTVTEVSAGGVAYRREAGRVDVVLISVGERRRWQLPKGLVEPDETPEGAALREVREEAGVETEMVAPLDKIEYWYFFGAGEGRTRVHKYVHFFLLRYLAGDPSQHDLEVNEARWMELSEALRRLSFQNERDIVAKAAELITNQP
jgi:8-oxo-dGTP pyrophosphatase MutT (NUDIX family)